VRGHRRAALHVLGQLAVAVVSRSMLMGLESLQVDGDGAYIASLYVPVLAAVVLVEWHVGSSLAALRRTFFARILRPTGRVAGRLTRPVGRLVEEP
jgi:hypothetical protein